MLTSKSGIQELFQASRTGVGSTLNSAVKQMASAISQRAEPKSEDGYIKCSCNNCEIFIEFPAHGLGQTIACPHCGMETVLFKPTATFG
jgi:Zn finger protein HypA/HybF involved in hydrogenase expression